jgi:hypothetical protein
VRQGGNDPVNRPISSGVTEHTLQGFNKNWNYCFQVLTIYSVEKAESSQEVCTTRSPAP